MKIPEYGGVSSLSDSDLFLVETGNVTKNITKEDLQKALGGGSGDNYVASIDIIAGHLMVTMSDGEVIDKGAFAGDMSTAVYDTDDSGIVDNSEKVNGFTVDANVPSDVNDRVKASVNDEILSLIK